MGPLATASQLKSAREGIGRLLEAARVVHGNPEGDAVVGADRGYFVTPLLLQADAPHEASVVHELEVFGPVATLLPYDGSAGDAAALVRRGQGSLVTSLYGDDRRFLGETIAALAAWNGRVVVTDAKVADKAFAPGMVMPQMLHGGPGRAGGGEELGGTRGMGLYQQRCAVQGNGPLLAKLLDA